PPRLINLFKRDGAVFNRLPFEISKLPEIYKTRENNSPEKALPLVLPVVVNGRIESPGMPDFYSFSGKAGEEVVIETSARRLGSPLDSWLAVFNSAGEKLAENDDDPQYKWYGELTHHSDSSITLKIPKDGSYLIKLKDLQNKGGPEYAYRLRVGGKLPDYEAWAFPSGLTVPRGGSGSFRVRLLRKDGFNGPVIIALKSGSGSGLIIDHAVVPEGKNEALVNVNVPEDCIEGVKTFTLEGLAVINGSVAIRPVIAADEEMQAFAWKHLVEAESMVILVGKPAPYAFSYVLPENKPVDLMQGNESRIRLNISRAKDFAEPLQLQLTGAPEGLAIRNNFIGKEKDNIMLILRADWKAKPGPAEILLTGIANLVVPDPANPENKNRRERIYVSAPLLYVNVLKGKGPPPEARQKKEAPRPAKDTTPEKLPGTKTQVTAEKPALETTGEKLPGTKPQVTAEKPALETTREKLPGAKEQVTVETPKKGERNGSK
ncbi:MAG: PPC domain-containing protein, partial [Candidatus Firestonebacteria bacterium]